MLCSKCVTVVYKANSFLMKSPLIESQWALRPDVCQKPCRSKHTQRCPGANDFFLIFCQITIFTKTNDKRKRVNVNCPTFLLLNWCPGWCIWTPGWFGYQLLWFILLPPRLWLETVEAEFRNLFVEILPAKSRHSQNKLAHFLLWWKIHLPLF